MYYSLEDLNNFDKLDFVMQIERKSGKQAAIHFCDCMTLILNKAKHNDYFDEMNDKLSWSRIAVEHDYLGTNGCDLWWQHRNF